MFDVKTFNFYLEKILYFYYNNFGLYCNGKYEHFVNSVYVF